MSGNPWENQISWDVMETLNGWVVTTKFNEVPLMPRGFDTRAQVDVHIEHERRLFHEVQRQIIERAASLT